jgi:hypothetical protein
MRLDTGDAVGALPWLFAGALAVILSASARSAFLRASAGVAVDHYYWILAARAYRGARRLPVLIPGKYLLEDERQAYPPGFGLFLAAFPEAFLVSRRSCLLVVAIDGLTLALVLGAGVTLGITPSGLVAIVLVYGLAPVLVAYNTQLTSRGLGNLLLVISLLAQVAAAASIGIPVLALALLGACALAAVIVTHKMTTQFFAFLWPFWPFALAPIGPWGSWIGALTPLVAFVLATLATGPRFQALQWRAHWDIVSFWGRNWRFLGAHQFRQSPIYGDACLRAISDCHGEGFVGESRYATLLASYLPFALTLPATLFITPTPPPFVIVWFAAAVLAAVATLYIPSLKCLGGGHLYMFNAVPPAALWWGFALSGDRLSPSVISLFALGLVGSLLSLAVGLLRRSGRVGAADSDASSLVARLAREPATRVAAFPSTFSERIALETHHAVFWGGHGLGFRTLEPYWPVMREPLGETFRTWAVSYAVLDLNWWPEGKGVFEAMTGDTTPESFGRFSLYRVAP